MKNILLFLSISFLNSTSSTDYSGSWVSSGDNFQNTLTLEKIDGTQNIYKFSFNGWRISYDTFTKQDIRFSGEMKDEVFLIEIKQEKAIYSDDGREFEEGWELYLEGEERCKVYFEFDDYLIKVKTFDCSFIYGGYGVSFDGDYLR